MLLFGPARPLLVALSLGGFAFLLLPLPRPPLVFRSFRAIAVAAYDPESILSGRGYSGAWEGTKTDM